MLNKINYYFNIFFILIFFPSFVTGVFLPNLICGSFILINLILKFHKIKNLFFQYHYISCLFIGFYLLMILSSFLSNHVYHSLETSLLYFLFLVYTLGLMTLFSGNIKFRELFFFCGIITCIILSLDAIYELFYGSNILGYSAIDGRIAGLFDQRWLIGRYLIYILPVLIGMYFLEINIFIKYKLIFYITVILTSFIIIFSGERASFLMLVIYFTMLITFFFRKVSLTKVAFVSLLILLFIITPFFFSESSERITNNLLLYLTSRNLDENHYLSMFLTSWKIFINNPILGVGPNNFRFVCSDQSYFLSVWSCSTHPHSITFQLLAETGIFGFLAVFSVFTYFLYKSSSLVFSKEFSYQSLGIYSLQCSILLYLFPFMITGNFFLSWYGFIFYLPIALFMVYSEKLK